MKNKIASAFYDKKIFLLGSEDTIDEEGGVISNSKEIKSSFKGNVNFSNFKKIQEDYGLDYEIDISITTDKKIEVDSFIQYENVVYTVTDVIPSDSHYTVVATKWQR